MAHLARLMAVLEQPPPAQETQVTPFGRLHPPLGFERYKAVQVVAALLRTDDPTAAAGDAARCQASAPPLPSLPSSPPCAALLHTVQLLAAHRGSTWQACPRARQPRRTGLQLSCCGALSRARVQAWPSAELPCSAWRCSGSTPSTTCCTTRWARNAHPHAAPQASTAAVAHRRGRAGGRHGGQSAGQRLAHRGQPAGARQPAQLAV